MIVLLMGVAGSGKSTVGEMLSEATGWPFFDADAFHPPANIEKQRQGIALTDEDRWPWLTNIHEKMLELAHEKQNGIFACSALKQTFRDFFREGISSILIVHLRGDRETIRKRVETRKGHFMPASLVDSQFQTLEEPSDALVIDIQQPLEKIIAVLKEALTER